MPEESVFTNSLRQLRSTTVSKSTPDQQDFTQSYAILIGINDYTNGIQALSTATHDAEALADLLERQHGYQVQRLTMSVSKARLTELFTQQLPATIQANDRLIVYFAGHGIALDGEDGPAGYLIPQDARPEATDSFLAMRDFNQWLSQFPCRHLLVILDCCFAGAFRWASTRSLKPLPPKLYREHFERFIRDPAWQVLTSAAYDQKALDFLTGNSLGERGNQQGHSPFAQAIFAALAGKGDLVPAGGDGVITATELYLYLRDSVEVAAEQQARHRQTPGLWPLQRHDKGEFIFFVPGQTVRLEPAPELTAENNPYRGLASYNYSTRDARLFFGRTKLIEELATLVEQHGLTLVLGASGTGKSSLVKAGLLPRLHPPEAEQVGATAWQVLPPMRPTDQPLRVLHHLLTHKLADGEAGAMPADLSRLTEALVKLVHDWCQAHAGQRLLLMVDQLEELITLCRNDAERTAFLDLLAALLYSQPNQLRIVLTLRSDFEPQFAKSPLFTQPTQAIARFIVPPLSQAELREVIEGPAAASTLFFEDSQLVDDLINEVVQTPGALPLLSFTLEQLYLRYLKRQEEGRNQNVTIDRALTRADYHALGGVIGSLNQRASEEYDKLPDDAHRTTLQRVMLRMVAVEGGELARRRVALDELTYTSGEENGRVQTALRQFVNARLLVRGQADADGDGMADIYVEPAHDALVRAWDKLLVWKRAADEYLPLQRRLNGAANQWLREGKATGALWNNNPRLGQLQHVLVGEAVNGRSPGWIASVQQTLWPKTTVIHEPTWLNQRETEFVQTSVNRRASVLRQIVGVTGFVILALTLLSIFANNQRITANRNATTAIAEANARATEVDIRTTAEAIAVTREAQRASAESTAVAERDEAQRQSRRSRASELSSQAQGVFEIAPERSLLLLVEAAKLQLNHQEKPIQAIEQNLHRVLGQVGGTPLHGHEATVDVLAFSSDNKWLASGAVHHRQLGSTLVNKDTVVRLWNLTNPREKPILLRGHQHEISLLAFHPKNRFLAVVDFDTVWLWNLQNLTTNAQILKGHNAAIMDIRFSPDGQWLATASADNTVRLWKLDSSVLENIVLGGHRYYVSSIAFSADGKWLASASYDHTVRVWQMDNLEQSPKILSGHQDWVNVVTFTPNGQWLVSASDDKTIRLWNTKNLDSQPTVLTGHQDDISAMQISPDGQWLASASDDGTVMIWSLNAIETSPHILQHQITAYPTLRFSPDSQFLANGYENTIHITEMANPDIPQLLLHGHEKSVWSLAYAPDGKLASGSEDMTVRLWDSTTTGSNSIVLYGHTDAVTHVSFGPLEQQLASASADKTIRLWGLDRLNESPHILRGYTDTIMAFTFAIDGQQLFGIDVNNTVLSWNTASDNATPITRHNLGGRGGFVATFSPNRRWLARTGGLNEFAIIWDMTDLNARPAVLNRFTDMIGSSNAIAFDPSGNRLAITNMDSQIRLWYIDKLYEQPMIPPLFDRTSGIIFTALAFNPTGDILASAAIDSNIRLWHYRESSAPTTILRGDEEGVKAIAFRRDGQQIAVAHNDGTIHLLSMTDSYEPIVLIGHQGAVNSVDFSLDGRYLVSGSNDATVRLWPLTLEAVLEIACTVAGRNLNQQEWLQYFETETYHKTCPQLPIHSDFINPLLDTGRDLAKHGLLERAITNFNQALELEPMLDIEPEREAHRLLALTLVEQGQQIASTGNLDDAIGEFKKAIELDPDLHLEPQLEAQVAWGNGLVASGSYSQAMAVFNIIHEISPTFNITTTLSATKWNMICWNGALAGTVQSILPACDRAVSLAPFDGNIHDSRGVARAVYGDIPGALVDFEHAIDWAKGWGNREEFITSRQTWIDALKAGRNPFNAALLEQLKNE